MTLLHRTEGIVLKGVPFGEADLIVSFLTPDYGVIGAFAKSPRKTKSRFGSSLEPLTHSNIAFWGKEDSKLPRLTQADIIEPFQELREKLDTFMAASEMAAFTLRLMPEGEANKRAFSLFKAALGMIKSSAKISPAPGLDHGFLKAVFKIRLLDIAGYSPSLKGCARCGREGYGFYTPDGSIVCDACASNDEAPYYGRRRIRLSPGSIKLYESLRTWEMEKVSRIRPSASMMAEIEGLVEAHAEHVHPERR